MHRSVVGARRGAQSPVRAITLRAAVACALAVPLLAAGWAARTPALGAHVAGELANYHGPQGPCSGIPSPC